MATKTKTWQPNQPLPGNYKWGYASRSRARAMARPVTEHVVVDGMSVDSYGYMLCTGGWAIVGTGGGRPCQNCVALVRDQLAEDG